MPKIQYISKTFNKDHQGVIDAANEIIAEYQAAGFVLTLRQLYYQFVSRDLLSNTLQSYKRLGGIINDGRLAGQIDWNAIEDRTRNVRTLPHWSSPADVIKAATEGYRRDSWEGQHTRCEVWIEKDALIGVIEGVCEEWDVPYFACRGYVSQSEVWSAPYKRWSRLRAPGGFGEKPVIPPMVIFYLGDHDPSGLDMTKDIQGRLSMFAGQHDENGRRRCGRVRVVRLALNMDQIEQYEPPPNPAKITDSRAAAYIEEYGAESWELDALSPTVISDLVDTAIRNIVDGDVRDEVLERQESEREELELVRQHWQAAVTHVKGISE